MKKLLAVLLALICLMSFVFADTVATEEAIDVPSKDTGEMATAEVLDEEDAAVEIEIGSGEDGAELPEDIAKVLANEIAKLAASDSIAAYFQTVETEDGLFVRTIDESGESITVALADILGGEPSKIAEFTTMTLSGYEKDEMGSVTVVMTFATPYEAGEKVAVLIGFVDPADESVEWYAFEGEVYGEDGGIKVEFPEEILEMIQEAEYVLLAVASL